MHGASHKTGTYTSVIDLMMDHFGTYLMLVCICLFSGLEQCLFYRICHYADKCNSGERKSQSAVWSQ